MSEPEPDIRIGDTEREQAMAALGEHMSEGRLSVDEYGDRSAKVTTAKTRGELRSLFADLPEPHPAFDGPAPAVRSAVAAPREGSTVERSDKRSDLHRLVAAAVPLSALIAAVLFFTVVHTWVIFLLPAAITMIGGAAWGDDWHDSRHRDRAERHRRRHEHRDRRFRDD